MTTDPFELTTGEYVPDPERDTTLLIDGYFDCLAAQLSNRGLPPSLLDEMREGHTRLIEANRLPVVDEPARHNLRMTLAILAGYRVLEPELGRAEALELVEKAFVEPLGDAMRAGTAAMLDAALDPFTTMVNLAKTREREAFGEAFTFERAVDDDRRYLLNVRGCFYHDVLVAGGAPELTPAMCAFDGNWISAIDPDRHGFRFERETTIGYGGGHCPFHFRRNDPDPAE
ncbi:L-2-amino-thiazoline-4-carboxylic acid hydrolase [Rhizohabitans arisaemae]|uniref:L-2-amino-thiazoline-4-carboxylic acid hydrolase n=1 Tax=Rhizohabitans arisaemae TaxID=2720610 RepID=UPI0024B20AA8|nr:L-2-amino-thiazoline-4-carboxylic acid hydrolase [Rhizohabitans arisaemae]